MTHTPNDGLPAAASLAAICVCALTPSLALALTINPIFGSQCGYCESVGLPTTSLAGNLPAQAAIDAAAQQVASQFGGTNITVNILFYGADLGGDVAESEYGSVAYSYDNYVKALAADAAAHPYNKTLAAAVANLPSGNGAAGDPATTFVTPTTAAGRALGLGIAAPSTYGVSDSTPEFDNNANYVQGNGTVDGFVVLGLNNPLSYTRPPPSASNNSNANPYDVQTAMEHEIDEVLGIGGGGSNLQFNTYDPNFAEDGYGVSGTVYGSLDLYRYSTPGVPSYQLSDQLYDFTGDAYFSVDGGATSVDIFNNGLVGDSGDWGLTPPPYTVCPGDDGSHFGGGGNVQDAFACNNVAYDVKPGTPEYTAFESIGYNPAPEPAAWRLLMLGFGAVGGAIRAAVRRRHGEGRESPVDPLRSLTLRQSRLGVST